MFTNTNLLNDNRTGTKQMSWDITILKILKKFLLKLILAVVFAQDEELDKRIVNGEKAELYAHPHQASLQLYQAPYGWYHICGAVLIGTNKIVTAAHCVEGQNYRNLRIEAGALNLFESPNAYEQTVAVASFIIHPGYNGNGNGIPNDIALIYLASHVTYNKNVQPATLAPTGSSFANSQCVITGWGRTVGGSSAAQHLKQAYITKITRTVCNSHWNRYGQTITDNQICVFEADDKAGTRPSACNGDSGGPIMCGTNFRYLAGVPSWGINNCSVQMPSVYTRISAYNTWITSN